MRWALATAGLIVFAALVLTVPGGDPYEVNRTMGLRQATQMLRGESHHGSFAADYVGARRLLEGRDPYPVLSEGFMEAGITWPGVDHRNPHPPTAFVVALPFATVDYQTGAMWWGWLQVALMVAAAILLGLPAWAALAGAPLLLLWPPSAFSILQTTALWLFGGALAWRLRERPRWAGAAVALAALPKGPAALLLWPAMRRRWTAAIGFGAVGVVATAILLLLEPSIISRWLAVAVGEGGGQTSRWDNGALISWGARLGGTPLALLTAVLVVAAAGYTSRRHPWAAAAWLAVAVLPAAWIYSLVPLVLTVRTKPAASVLAIVPLLTLPFGVWTAVAVAVVTGVLGLELIRSAAKVSLQGRPAQG